MKKIICALLAFTTTCLSTGCASGGFKLTRQYAGFVNKQDLIIRIILYLLTAVVFAVTVLIDMVIFNTMDFWEGRVSAGDYQFKEGERTFHAHHEVLPGTGLKRSTIKVTGADNQQIQEVVLNETPDGEIEVLIDGKLRTKVHGINEVPIASMYGKDGEWLEDRVIVAPTGLARAQASDAISL